MDVKGRLNSPWPGVLLNGNLQVGRRRVSLLKVPNDSWCSSNSRAWFLQLDSCDHDTGKKVIEGLSSHAKLIALYLIKICHGRNYYSNWVRRRYWEIRARGFFIQSELARVKATYHLTISMRGQRVTGKNQRYNYHHGSCGPSLMSKKSSVSFILTHRTHRNVKIR